MDDETEQTPDGVGHSEVAGAELGADEAQAAAVDTEARDDTERDEDTDALLSRLRLIEDQPLDARAAAFTQVHDELRAALEGGDSPGHHG